MRMLAKDLRDAVLQAAVTGRLSDREVGDSNIFDVIESNKARRKELQKEGTIAKDKKLIKLSEEVSSISLPDHWGLVELQSLSEQITDGEHKTPRRVSKYEGFYLLSARNITNEGILLNDVDYVDEKEFKRISARCNPRRDDVLISCSGSVGRVCVVEDDNRYTMVRSAAMVRCMGYHLLICVMYCEVLTFKDK